jgi:hypothetical protein
MQLSHELVTEFQNAHLKKYGERIPYDIAESQLKQLADLVRITTKKGENVCTKD